MDSMHLTLTVACRTFYSFVYSQLKSKAPDIHVFVGAFVKVFQSVQVILLQNRIHGCFRSFIQIKLDFSFANIFKNGRVGIIIYPPVGHVHHGLLHAIHNQQRKRYQFAAQAFFYGFIVERLKENHLHERKRPLCIRYSVSFFLRIARISVLLLMPVMLSTCV